MFLFFLFFFLSIQISQALAVSLPALAKFRNHRHILVPDFAVHNKKEVCLFMPKAGAYLIIFIIFLKLC